MCTINENTFTKNLASLQTRQFELSMSYNFLKALVEVK